MDLNPEQLAAATHPPGEAALLLAGAGSGKTRTLSERISWLIGQGVEPTRILAISFTNKAAGEIRERVLARTGLAPGQAPELTTIHSFAFSLVRSDPSGFGFRSRPPKPYDDYHQRTLLKQIIERERLEDRIPGGAAEAMRHIAYHRSRGVGFAADYGAEAHASAAAAYRGAHALGEGMLRLWTLYEEEKRLMLVVDFDDMLWMATRRMARDPGFLARLQARFDHAMVDECQDINRPQFDLVSNVLAPDNRNLMLIGDLNQSIYGFMGAQPEILKGFAESWRGRAPALYRLALNHRSAQAVVDLANAVSGSMKDSLPLAMASHRGRSGARGEVRVFADETPREIGRRIAAEIAGGGRPYSSYAVLVRSAKSEARDIEYAFLRARIPYVVRGGDGFLDTEEVRDVMSYLRLAVNPMDFVAFSRAAQTPPRGAGPAALAKARARAAAEFEGDLVAAAKAMGGPLATFASIVRALQACLPTPERAAKAAIAMTLYRDHLKKAYRREDDLERLAAKLANLDRLEELFREFSGQGTTTEDLVFQLTMGQAEEDRDRDAKRPKVTISTIHSAKGLEWDRCYVFSVVEGVIPHVRSTRPEEIEEDRRVLYVAVSRARDACVLCVPRLVPRGDKLVQAKPSRFFEEAGLRLPAGVRGPWAGPAARPAARPIPAIEPKPAGSEKIRSGRGGAVLSSFHNSA